MCSIFMELGLKNFLREKECGFEMEIEEIGENIMIAEKEGNFIVFVNEKICLGPMGIAIEDIKSFKMLELKEGDNIKVDKECIFFSDAENIDISDAEIVDLRLSQNLGTLSHKKVRTNLLHIEEFLYNYGKRSGMLPVLFNIGDYIGEFKTESDLKMYNNMYTSLIYPKMISLFEKLIQGRFEKVEFCIRDLIEFGTENNEYSNGFLLGLMTSLIYGGMAYGVNMDGAVMLNRHLMKGIESVNRTENFYTSILNEAVDGGSPKIIKDIIESTITETDSEVLDEELRHLIKFDKLSGTDIICGVYTGIRLMEKDKFRNSIDKLSQV